MVCSTNQTAPLDSEDVMSISKKELIYMKPISSLVWSNQVASKSNATLSRQIIIYMHTYTNTKVVCPFLLALSRGKELVSVLRSLCGSEHWHPTKSIQVLFSLEVTNYWYCGQQSVSASLRKGGRERRPFWQRLVPVCAVTGAGVCRCHRSGLCEDRQTLPLTHAGSFCSGSRWEPTLM